MRACRFPCVFGAIAALLGVGRAGTAQSPGANDQMERPEVRSLTLSGVRSVDRDELTQSIATTASRCKSVLLNVFCPLFFAFGPEPIAARIGLGDGKVLVTTEALYKKKIAPITRSPHGKWA